MLRSYYNKFNRGEIDEKAMARDDLARVNDSASLMENWVPERLGPMQYRPGTKYLGAVVPNLEHYLIPFLSKGNENAVIELSASSANPSVNTMRVWIDDALMTRTGTADTITNPNFTSNITGWTDDSDAGGASAWTADQSGCLAVNGNGTGGWGRAYQTQTLTSGKRTLNVWVYEAPVYLTIGTAGTRSNDIFSDWLNPGFHSITFTATAVAHTYTFQNDKAYRGLVGSCDYAAAGVFSLAATIWFDTSTLARVLPTVRYVQAADTMFICSNGYELEGRARPYIMFQRRGTESWSFVLPDNIDGPFGLVNDTSLTLAVAAVTGNTTLTANKAWFKSTCVGEMYEIVHGATVGRCVITSYTSSTVVNVQITETMGNTTAVTEWYRGMWGDYLPSPTALEMFEGRLCLAGAGEFNASVSDAYTSFDANLEGSDVAIQKTIGFGTVQDISWLVAGEQLLMGMTSEEVKISSNDFGDALTAVNTNIRRATNKGSAVGKPVIVDKVVYFVQRALKKIIALSGLSKEEVEAEDITILHPDICSPGIKRMCYAAEPEPRIYVLLTDGTLRVFLFDKAEDVRGWSRVTLGGGGTVEDICSVPTNTEDSIYMVVERGGTRYFEKLAKFSEAIGQSDSRHYDSHVVYASPGVTLTGLGHLEGLTVNVWGDGIDRETQVVSGGSITVSQSWTDVVVGLRHTAKFLSNRLSRYVGNSVLSDNKRIVRIAPIMKNVALRTIKYGPDENTLDNMPQIAEGKVLAPTTEAQSQIVDTIVGATAGAITANDIDIQGDYAIAACLTIPVMPAAFRDELIEYYDGSLYLPGGLQTGSVGTTEVWRYNTVGGALTPLAAMPVAGVQHASTILTGQVFIYTGDTNGFMKYVVSTDTWSTPTQPGVTGLLDPGMAAYSGEVFLYGADESFVGAPVRHFNVGGNSWATPAATGGPPSIRKNHAMCAPQAGTGAGKFYICCGLTGPSLSDLGDLWEYTISTDTWASLSGSGLTAKGFPRMVAPGNGKLYLFGGKPRVGTNNHDAKFQVYDIAGNSWSEITAAPKPFGRTQFGMAASSTKIWVYGGTSRVVPGQGTASINVRDLWEFNIAAGTWTEIVTWDTGLESFAGALRIVDVSDSGDLGNTAALNLESADQDLKGYAVVTDASYAYLSTVEETPTNRGLAVVDIIDPTAPDQVGYLEGGTNTTTVGRAMVKSGDVVFLQSFAVNGSLAAIDVSTPSAPVLLSQLVLTYGSNPVNSEKMELVYPYLYIPWENDLHIVDITNPSALALAATYNFVTMTAANMVVKETDNMLWAIDTAGILTVLSLANPIAPEEVGSLTDATNLSAVQDFLICTPYVYAVQATTGHVVDISTPAAPVLFASYSGFTGIKSLASNNPNHLFAGSTTGAGVFYSADQRSNAYVDYDELPFEFDGEYDPDSRVYFQSQGPATVIAMVYDVEDSDIETDSKPG